MTDDENLRAELRELARRLSRVEQLLGTGVDEPLEPETPGEQLTSGFSQFRARQQKEAS